MHPLQSSTSSHPHRKKPSQPPSTAVTERKLPKKKERLPRNPLKDLNSSSRSCNGSSAASTSASGEGVRFFLSSSTKSSFVSSRPVRCLPKTPKSAPVANARVSNKPLLGSRLVFSKESSSKGAILEKPILQKPQKCKKDTNLMLQGQPGKGPVAKGVRKCKNYSVSSKLSSGSGELKLKEQQKVVKMHGNEANLTPVTKLGTGSGLDCRVRHMVTDDHSSNENSSVSVSKTPPVQASVSPEIQCGSVITKTPACYAAGYIVSGVSDKRKCRPKGILTVGDNGLGFGKPKALNDFDDDDEMENVVVNSNLSMVPLPADASMHWLLSPCDEEKEDEKENSDDGSCQFAGSEGPETPMLSSHRGFSSDTCNISSSRSMSMDESGNRTRRRRSISSLSPSELSLFKGFRGPLYDNSLAFTRNATPTCKAAPKLLRDERKHRYNLGEENSPFPIDTLGSENISQTPDSDSSLDRYVGHSWVEAEDGKHHVDMDSEIKGLTMALQSASLSNKSHVSVWDPSSSSFQFDSLTTPSNSIDLSQFRTVSGDRNSWHSNVTSDNMSLSHMRISWRDRLSNSQIYEVDEYDSCRCLSDDEENGNNVSSDPLMKSDQSPNTDFDAEKDVKNAFSSTDCVDKDPVPEEKDKEKLPPLFPCSSMESISTDGGGLVRSEDSDWMTCYKNDFIEV